MSRDGLGRHNSSEANLGCHTSITRASPKLSDPAFMSPYTEKHDVGSPPDDGRRRVDQEL
jgi:hypothetical protein